MINAEPEDRGPDAITEFDIDHDGVARHHGCPRLAAATPQGS
ncbi:MAG: hypothetical protein ACLUQW_01605 [Collinsella sp.]